MTLAPQAAKAVFDHVPHDPVRCKQLGGGGDICRADFDVLFEVGEHLFFRLGVVILVQPAHDLHSPAFIIFFEPVGFGDVVYQMADHAVLIGEGERQQQRHIVVHLLKQAGQAVAQRGTLLEEQQPECFVQLVVVFEVDDLLLLCRGVVQHCVKRGGDDLRLGAAIRAGQNPRAAGQQVVDLHIPHRNQPVEPCVGNLIHHSLVRRRVAALLGGLLIQLRHKALPLGDGVALDAVGLRQANVKELHGFIGLWQRLGNSGFRHANQPGAVFGIGNQLIARPYSKLFDCGFVHGFIILLSNIWKSLFLVFQS